MALRPAALIRRSFLTGDAAEADVVAGRATAGVLQGIDRADRDTAALGAAPASTAFAPPC
jgi:hypothetical protein